MNRYKCLIRYYPRSPIFSVISEDKTKIGPITVRHSLDYNNYDVDPIVGQEKLKNVYDCFVKYSALIAWMPLTDFLDLYVYRNKTYMVYDHKGEAVDTGYDAITINLDLPEDIVYCGFEKTIALNPYAFVPPGLVPYSPSLKKILIGSKWLSVGECSECQSLSVNTSLVEKPEARFCIKTKSGEIKYFKSKGD